MAITDKEQGVWELDQVYNKINQGSIWAYTGEQGLFRFGQKGVWAAVPAPGSTVSSPTQITGGTSFTKIYPNGATTMFGAQGTGTLYSWGYNTYGNLGVNSRTNHSSPIQIPGTTWVAAGAGIFNAGGLKSDGSVWQWGYNHQSQLGQGNKTAYSSPVQIPGSWGTTADKYATTSQGGMAIKTDGTLWTWGYNTNGALGQNQAEAQLAETASPVQVGTNTNWNKVCGSSPSNLGAIKTDGTLWVWGYGRDGNLGQNTALFAGTNSYSSPVQIPGTTWDIVRGSGYIMRSIKTDGTLWAWGRNIRGSLGQNNTANYSSPIQIGTDTTWEDFDGDAYTTIAKKTNGSVWTIGSNTYGQLGQNDTTQRSSPVQVFGANSSTVIVAAAYNSNFATGQL